MKTSTLISIVTSEIGSIERHGQICYSQNQEKSNSMKKLYII